MVNIVKKLSQQIKAVQEALTSINIKVLALNHAPSRCDRHNGYKATKGVDSDHIKIFKLTDSISIAFAFYYTKTTTPYVMVTHKVGGKIVSAQYKEEAFRQKINQFVTLLKVLQTAKSLSIKTVESTFLANFIQNQEYDEDSAIDESIQTIKKGLKQLNSKYATKIQLKKSLNDEITQKKAEIEKTINAAKIKAGIPELQKQLHHALNKIDKLSESLRKDSELEQKEKKLSLASRELFDYENQVEGIIAQGTSTLPKHVRDSVKRKLTELNKTKS